MRIAFFNPQGNFHPEDLYLTEHPDFGGQLIYVKEVAKALASKGHLVDIITRRIQDEKMPGFEKELHTYPGYNGLRILRIRFGGQLFRPKEELWPYLKEYVEGIISLYHQEGDFPQVVTGHYGDGGLAAALFSQKTGIPFTFTIHSPGALKMEKMGLTKENIATIDEKYNFSYRIYGEGKSMEHSCINIVSTRQEHYKQYGHPVYRQFIDTQDERRFIVVPPGVNTKVFYTGDDDGTDFIPFLERDLDPTRLHLPGIIASSRLDEKKNHRGLVEAFGESKELQERANLLIALRGIIDPWQGGEGAQGTILHEILALIEKYSLKGSIVFLDIENQEELACCYRYLSGQRGVFALTALYEPFGLAPLEAAACGLPVVVTKNGGPWESLREGDEEYGVLVDPLSTTDIATGLLRVLEDQNIWEFYYHKGLRRVLENYTWEQTAAGYIKAFKHCSKRDPGAISFPWPERIPGEDLLQHFKEEM